MLSTIHVPQTFTLPLARLLLVGTLVLNPIATIPAQERSTSQNDTCIRAVPKPIVKKNVFPKTKFSLQKERENGLTIFTGLETIDFNNGDRLYISHTGCEYVTLAFKFETRRIAPKTTARKYLYTRSAGLMKQILRGLNSPINLQRGIVALEKYGSKNEPIELDTEIDYGNADPRSVVKLANVKRLKNDRVEVEIIFSYGPL